MHRGGRSPFLGGLIKGRQNQGGVRGGLCAGKRSQAANSEVGIRGHYSVSATSISQVCVHGHGSGDYGLSAPEFLKYRKITCSTPPQRRGVAAVGRAAG